MTIGTDWRFYKVEILVGAAIIGIFLLMGVSVLTGTSPDAVCEQKNGVLVKKKGSNYICISKESVVPL